MTKQSHPRAVPPKARAGKAALSNPITLPVDGVPVPPPLSREATPDLTHRTGGGDAPSFPAGSDLARRIRLYGGPSLETRRDDADTSLKLFSVLAIVAGGFGAYFAGEGYVPGIPLTCAVLSIVSIGGLFWAASRRNRIQARLDDVDAKVTRAVSDAVAVRQLSGMAA